jgi:rSAM-associated Gly-rich repeat protein
MKIAAAGLVGFLMALAAVGQSANASAPPASPEPTNVESRLSRITELLKDRESQLQDSVEIIPPGLELIARGVWGNGRGGAWGNGGARFVNSHGPGGFYNARPGGWRDIARFYNYRY